MERKDIADQIGRRGVCVAVYLDGHLDGNATTVENLDKIPLIHEMTHTTLNSGYAHSIGFHELGLPEVLIFVGPAGDGDDSATTDEMVQRLKDAAKAIKNLYRSRETVQLCEKFAYENERTAVNGLRYAISHTADDFIPNAAKRSFMQSVFDYYDGKDFTVIVMKLCNAEIISFVIEDQNLH